MYICTYIIHIYRFGWWWGLSYVFRVALIKHIRGEPSRPRGPRIAGWRVFVSNLHQDRRILVGQYHYRMMCRCGCRGTHTIQCILEKIAWDFRVAATGIWPSVDASGKPWPEESWRRAVAGKPMFRSRMGNCKAALVEVAADLDEVAKTFGLADYRSNFGCLRCFAKWDEFSNLAAPVRKRRHQWLVDTASTSLFLHDVTDASATVLRSNSKPRYSKAGVVVQRMMRTEFPNIKRGDRIEAPQLGRPDVWHGESCLEYRRSSRQILVYRRAKSSPLFINRLICVPGIQSGIPGLKLEHFLFDSMHFADLGILQYFGGLVMWRLVQALFFGPYSENDTAEVDVSINDSLMQWYSSNNIPRGSRVVGLSLGMCGDKDSPLLKLKAGKTRAVLPYLVHILRKGGRDLLDRLDPVVNPGTLLLTVGDGMMQYFDILKGEPRKMSELSLVHLQHTVDTVMHAWIALGRSVPMKFHVFGKHITDQARFSGNPGWSHNYRDESENFGARKRTLFTSRVKFAEQSLVKWFMHYLHEDARRDNLDAADCKQSTIMAAILL